MTSADKTARCSHGRVLLVNSAGWHPATSSAYIGSKLVKMDDDAICTLLARLARPNASGGDVIERAAILAAGSDFNEIMKWVIAHGGKPEAMAPVVPSGGLHGSRMDDSRETDSRTPVRFVLPPGALAAGRAAARSH